jgi:drug/metabolite transporter (DMT)-like permease
MSTYVRTLVICAAVIAGGILLLVLDDMKTNSQVHTITTSSLVFLAAIMGAVVVAVVASVVKFVRG